MEELSLSEKLCLVEDDPTIGELVAQRLRLKGYTVEVFVSAEQAWPKAGVILHDLYIVDILLPGMSSGLDLCRKLRQLSPTVPILVLSALSEPSDRIEGLKSGADDYLVKPFEMEELFLRVHGMLKRRLWYRNFPKLETTFHWDGNTIDLVRFEGNAGQGPFSMSQKECMLMKLLIEREGEVVSREQILDRVWGYNVFPSTRTVDNVILRIRRYFEATPSEPKYIHSVRGLGYRFTCRPSPKTSGDK